MEKASTGIKDRNGKIIRDGDLLDTPLGIAEVVFYKAAYRLRRDPYLIPHQGKISDWEKSEIIDRK